MRVGREDRLVAEAVTAGLDLPDESFDYNEFVKKEFGAKSPVPRACIWFWWLVGIGLAAGLLLWGFR